MTYRPGDSLLHRLHPLVKLIWLLWGTVAVFLFSSATLPLAVAAAALAALWSAGIRPWRSPGLRLWAAVGMMVLFVQAALIREGAPLLWFITTGGLTAGLRALGRLLAVILMSTTFVTTTEPYALACALMKFGLPYRWGFALVTALRLAPVFRLEAHHVYRAQLVRGVAYGTPGPRRYWLMLQRLALPLVVSALRNAQALSWSMEGRAFGLHPRRTFVHSPTLRRRDVAALFLLTASLAGAVWHGLARAT